MSKVNKEKENYIISEIEIKEDDINKDIRIINSFEEMKRKINGKIIKMIINIKMKKK